MDHSINNKILFNRIDRQQESLRQTSICSFCILIFDNKFTRAEWLYMQLISTCIMILCVSILVMKQMPMLWHSLIVTWNNVFHQISMKFERLSLSFVFTRVSVCHFCLSMKEFINIFMLSDQSSCSCFMRYITIWNFIQYLFVTNRKHGFSYFYDKISMKPDEIESSQPNAMNQIVIELLYFQFHQHDKLVNWTQTIFNFYKR